MHALNRISQAAQKVDAHTHSTNISTKIMFQRLSRKISSSPQQQDHQQRPQSSAPYYTSPNRQSRSRNSLSSLFSLSSTSRASDLEENADTRKLDCYLLDREACNMLIRDLHVLGFPNEAFYLRFLAYYNDYRSTVDSSVKRKMGKKLMEMFVQPGAATRLIGIDDLNISSVKDLPRLRVFLLLELVKLPEVLEKLQDV